MDDERKLKGIDFRGLIGALERRAGVDVRRVGYTRRMWEDWLGGMEGVLECSKVERLGTRVASGGRDGDHRIEVVLRYGRDG